MACVCVCVYVCVCALTPVPPVACSTHVPPLCCGLPTQAPCSPTWPADELLPHLHSNAAHKMQHALYARVG